jgi:CPA1 family monovalent cation:H+ antiporter
VDREVRLARVEIARAALIATPNRRGEEIADLQRRRYEVMLRRAEADLAAGGDGQGEAAANERRAPDVDATVVREALSAERHRLLALRADGTIGDTAFQRVEQGLDLEELHLQQLVSITGDLYEE